MEIFIEVNFIIFEHEPGNEKIRLFDLNSAIKIMMKQWMEQKNFTKLTENTK